MGAEAMVGAMMRPFGAKVKSVMRDWLKLRLLYACALLFAFAASVCQAGLDEPEKRAIEHIRAHETEAFALLETLVEINSGTMNFAGVRRVAEVLRPHFEALGFSTRWEDGAPYGRAGHLIAERPGTGPRVLLIGHLDTVFEPGHPFQRFERRGHIAHGPGTADMKGGIVVALTALAALRVADALDRLHLTVILHGDEEDAGAPLTLARKTLVDAARAADIAIGLENADNDPRTAVVARRGSSRWRISVTAKSAHSSQIFTDEVGAGANYELARILAQFYRELRGEEHLTFNAGLIAGSTQVEYTPEPPAASVAGKDNIVAPQAVASGDLRAISIAQRERAKERMRRIVAQHLPGTAATIEFEDGYPPMSPSAGNDKLLALYDEASRDLGFGPVVAVDPRKAGAADISFAAEHVAMAIDGLGLLGGKAHTAEEFADLRTFEVQAQRLALLLMRLSR